MSAQKEEELVKSPAEIKQEVEESGVVNVGSVVVSPVKEPEAEAEVEVEVKEQ